MKRIFLILIGIIIAFISLLSAFNKEQNSAEKSQSPDQSLNTHRTISTIR